MRFGLQAAVQQLADTMNVPVATMMYGKGGFDENHQIMWECTWDLLEILKFKVR